MSSNLVKIGLPPKQAEGERVLRRIRQIMDQRDAAVARLDAATRDRIRQEIVGDSTEADRESDAPLAEAAVS